MATPAAARPLVKVYNGMDGSSASTLPLPAVFTAPIRRDVVHFVHTNMAKNKRQPYAVSLMAGFQTSAESWGTGRAVARIPRVGGGGTSRSGQGAFGNMCRGGRMFAPTKIWRRWHRKINVNQKRYAVASALAASAVPALVQARGHKIDEVNEIPLVLDGITGVAKTAEAMKILERFGAGAEVQKARDSKKLRAGKGKMRNRRYVTRRGPLVVYDAKSSLEKAFRNLPGVELAQVDRLNLLQLAPGGHMGRFIVWTKDAFEKLDSVFGTHTTASTQKADYKLPRAAMANTDLARIINSGDVQEKVHDKKCRQRFTVHKKNPLKNFGHMVKLNPYAMKAKRLAIKASAPAPKTKVDRAAIKANKAASQKYYKAMVSDEYTQ